MQSSRFSTGFFSYLTFLSTHVKLQAHKIYLLFHLDHCYLKALKAPTMLRTENILKAVTLLVAHLP